MLTRRTPFIVIALAVGPAAVSAAQLGRLDIAAPGAMISTCGGIGQSTAPGDSLFFQPGRSNCNAQQTALPNAIVSQSATYTEAPVTVDTFASGQATMGQTKLFAHSRARQDSGSFPQATATGGWVDMLTLNPVNPAQIGQTANFSFLIDVGGTLAGQGATHSFNSLARFGITPYLNDATFVPGPEAQFAIQGQGQINFPYNQTVNQLVTFTTNVTLGTPFELGVFARALAGNASSGSVTAFSEAPLFMVFYLGVGLLASSSLVAAVLVVRWLFFGKMLDGWPSLMVSIWFLGGLCIFCQGILGIYLARVFQEAKRRPVAIVRHVHESEGAANAPLRLAQ